jgi:hypothetical protein
MEDRKYMKRLLDISRGYQIDKYRELNLEKTHKAFEGTPKKHPHDENVLILLTDPFSNFNRYYEFSLESIGHVEDLGTISSETGKSTHRIRVWVKKGMPAIKSTPFIVK